MIENCSQNAPDQTQTQSQTAQDWSNSQSQDEDKKTSWGRIIPKRVIGRLGYGNIRLHESLSASFELCEESFSIGRSDEADWIITDQQIKSTILDRISKNHCRIFKDCSSVENPVFIEDLSRNGTFLNGELIGTYGKRILKTDDVISFNEPRLKFFQFINCYQESFGLPEEIVQQYHIGKELGAGAQGKVRLVIDRKTCNTFAMKIVKRTRYNPNNRMLIVPDKKIMREAEIMSKMEHPHIIKCDNFTISGHYIYMFLDYMEGGDLLHRLQREKYLSLITTKHFFRQLCGAVKYLHDNGYIHRDIKPDNILLQSGDDLTNLKISDFGLSKIVSKDSESHTLCGTPLYVSPEIQSKSGRARYTNKVDVWSLGVVLYAMICGRLPFVNTGNETAAQRILAGKFNFEHAVFLHVPESVKDLIRKMLTVNPNKRPTINEVMMHPWLKYEDADSVNELNDMFDKQIGQAPKRRRIE